MTQLTDVPAAPISTGDTRIIGLISAAHFVSHVYILLLPPLFVFVRGEYGVSYTELGLAIAAFNVTSAVFQTPAGFLVDRIGARAVLFAGLLLGAASILIAAVMPWFWALVVMFGVLGIANTVYHPADYAVLSKHVSPERMGQAFSVHTFSGMLGSAAAPATLLTVAASFGWRGAFIAAAGLGLVVAVVFLLQREPLIERAAALKEDAPSQAGEGTAWDLLLSAPIIRNLIFFVLLSLAYNGIQSYVVVALDALYGTPLATGNAALSVYLLLTAFAILAGGFLATRTTRHDVVAAIGLIVGAACMVVIAAFDPGVIGLMLLMAVAGFSGGVIMPSRDMIVRAVTPEGSFGKVFGFVTTGFNFAGIIAPLLFGALMDHGSPRWIFFCVAGFSVLAILTVVTFRPRRAAELR